jgi:hypothetical protein
MDRAKTLLRRPRIFFILGAALLVFLLAGGGALYLTQAHPEQPIAFPHSTHVGIGAQCIYCHSSATFSPLPVYPVMTNVGAVISKSMRQSPELDKLANYVRNNEPFPGFRLPSNPILSISHITGMSMLE